MIVVRYNELSHHGILGQQWGKRNGPPYPLKGGDYSEREVKMIYDARKRSKRNIYNKKHFDTVIKKGTTLNTLSWNKDRLKNTDYFFAAHTTGDKNRYMSKFGSRKGLGFHPLKWKIKSKLASDMNVASEDSAANTFKKLFKEDRDFYNYVTDPKRMGSFVPERQASYKEYQESLSVLKKIRESGKVSEDDIDKVYRLFNYTLPNDGGGNERVRKDVLNQRTKFFDALKEQGYGAILDTNDSIYGYFNSESPVIVFDMANVMPESVKKLNYGETKVLGPLVSAGSNVCNKILKGG